MQLIFSKCRFVNPVRINEALIPTTVILVWAQDELLHLNSTLILGDCVGERLALEVAFRYWSCKLVEIPSFGCNVSLWCVLTEKWQLRWIGTTRIYDNGDDDDDDDVELFLWYGWLTKGVESYFQPGSLSEILTITNLWIAASKIWTYAYLSVGFVDWSCAEEITTASQRHIYSRFCVTLSLLQVCDCKEGETVRLNFMGERVHNCVRRNQEWWWR